MIHRWYWSLAVVLAGGVLAASCAVPAAQPGVPANLAVATPTPDVAASAPATPSPTTTATPWPTSTATPSPTHTPSPTTTSTPTATPTPTPAPATPTARAASQRLDLDESLPAGRGRDLFLMNCGSCHSIACAMRGQRTVAHWEQLRQQHSGKVPGLSEEDYNTLFAYLSENLNDTKPEPKLPPLLATQGCSFGIE